MSEADNEEKNVKPENNQTEDIQSKKEPSKKKSARDIMQNMAKKVKTEFIAIINDKKRRLKLILWVAFVLFILIGIPVIDAIISDRSLNTGINDLSLISYIPLTAEDTHYIAFNINFQHDGSWNKVLKKFDCYLIQDNDTVSIFHWKSFYQREGNLNIGGSFIVPMDEFNISESFLIKAEYTIHKRFGKDISDSYSEWLSFVAVT